MRGQTERGNTFIDIVDAKLRRFSLSRNSIHGLFGLPRLWYIASGAAIRGLEMASAADGDGVSGRWRWLLRGAGAIVGGS